MRPRDLTAFEQHVLLATLRKREDAYGVTIMDEIEARTGRRPSTGATYAALTKLEESGFLTSREGEPTEQRGGRRKTFFRLTANGRRALDAAMQAVDSLREGVFPIGGLANG